NRLLVRDRIWTPEDFAKGLNEVLASYAASPVRTAPNSRIVADFWRDPNVGALPYQRGNLLALIWDKRLADESEGAHDLDDVVLDMKARFMSEEHGTGLAVDNLVAAMKSAGVDPSEDIARFVDKGEAILLPADLFEPCGPVATLELPEFTRGFDA